MHDIKLIRKNPDFFSKKLVERNSKIDLKNLLDLDKKNRELIQNKEKLEQEKKIRIFSNYFNIMHYFYLFSFLST